MFIIASGTAKDDYGKVRTAYSVGYIQGGEFVNYRTCFERATAEQLCHYLNGGSTEQLINLETTIKELKND